MLDMAKHQKAVPYHPLRDAVLGNFGGSGLSQPANTSLKLRLSSGWMILNRRVPRLLLGYVQKVQNKKRSTR